MRRSPALESQSSFERIQQLVKKEGKTARNLVAWSVPAPEQAKAIPRSRGRAGKAVGRRPPRARGSEQLSRSERMCLAAAGQYSNSALGGKEGGRPVNKSDVHARYWSYLFDNLFRAVDEIYKTCEVDGSVIECQVWLHIFVCLHTVCVVYVQEVMMTLDACHRDFAALIHRIDLERQLETYPHNRSEYISFLRTWVECCLHLGLLEWHGKFARPLPPPNYASPSLVTWLRLYLVEEKEEEVCLVDVYVTWR